MTYYIFALLMRPNWSFGYVRLERVRLAVIYTVWVLLTVLKIDRVVG